MGERSTGDRVTSRRPFRFGVVAAQVPSAEAWVTTARRVETLGYSTLLTPDTLGPTPAPLIALTAAAAATRTLRVGTYVLVNDFRNPVLVAREAATLDLLSGGRFELGLGVGRPTAGDDYRSLGIDLDGGGIRVKRLAESLDIVTTLLEGGTAHAPGPHYAVEGATVFPAPVQRPRPPILVAGTGRRLLSLAATRADIVAVGAAPQESEAAVAEKVGWIREAAGERAAQPELAMNLFAVGPHLPQFVGRLFPGLDLSELVRSGAPSVVMGSPEEMCEQLLARRETLGVSYVTVPEFAMEAFAPVVDRLTGR